MALAIRGAHGERLYQSVSLRWFLPVLPLACSPLLTAFASPAPSFAGAPNTPARMELTLNAVRRAGHVEQVSRAEITRSKDQPCVFDSIFCALAFMRAPFRLRTCVFPEYDVAYILSCVRRSVLRLQHLLGRHCSGPVSGVRGLPGMRLPVVAVRGHPKLQCSMRLRIKTPSVLSQQDTG